MGLAGNWAQCVMGGDKLWACLEKEGVVTKYF